MPARLLTDVPLQVSFCRELWYELKFQLCCAGEKPSQWDHDQLNDNPDEDSLAKSLDRLDLSLGKIQYYHPASFTYVVDQECCIVPSDDVILIAAGGHETSVALCNN